MSGSLLTLLRMLSSRDIEFVVVGGMAGVLHGAPVVTADLDIVHRQNEENVARLLSLLLRLEATFRGDPRKLRPDASHLLGSGHLRLSTNLGPLDVLCEVGGQGFEGLVSHTESLGLGEGREARVVTLEKLIELKQLAARPKDQLALPILKATLEEVRRRGR